jgi:hypothetical protein
VRCSATPNRDLLSAVKTAGLAAAASLLLVQPGFAGPLDNLLPNSSGSAGAKSNAPFVRDLGEGRKLVPSSDQETGNRATRAGGGPSISADAREDKNVEVVGGSLPGIAKKLAPDSNAAPLTNPNRGL